MDADKALKEVNKTLNNKRMYRRAVVIISIICVTVIIIAVSAFVTGAFRWSNQPAPHRVQHEN